MAQVVNASIEKVFWQDVQKEVTQVNPEFAKQLDELSPGKSLYFYKVKYPFGCPILKDSVLQIPDNNGAVLPINHTDIPNRIREDLDYAPLPLGLSLKNSMETFFELTDEMIPQQFIRPGRLFGLWAGLSQNPRQSAHGSSQWQATAGARLLFFLSKISNTIGYRRLRKEFRLKTEMPKNLTDQWPFLVKLANADNFGSPWQVELLLLTSAWHQLITAPTQKALPLSHYLLQYVWQDSALFHEQSIFNFAFSLALNKKNLRTDPYLVDTLKHLYFMSHFKAQPLGFNTGFIFAQDDTAAPIQQFQSIFHDLYNLSFAPSILHRGIHHHNEFLHPIYYSLNIPTVMRYQPKSNKLNNKVHELRELHTIEKIVRLFFNDIKSKLFETSIRHLVTETDIRFFHPEADFLYDIHATKQLIELDQTLLNEQTRYQNKPFCQVNAFFTGCVRISPKLK